MPALGRAFLKAFWQATKSFWQNNDFNDCAAISYYALISIVPLVSLSTAALSYFVDGSSGGIQAVLERAGLVIPQFGAPLEAAVEHTIRNRTSIGLVSLAATIWFSSLVFGSIQGAFDRIFGTFHAPIWGTIKPRLVALAAAMLLILGFFFNTVVTLLRSLESAWAIRIVALFDSLPVAALLSGFVADVLIFMMVLLTLPPRRVHDWRLVIPAALVGAIGWRMARSLFGIYLSYAASNLTFTGSASAALIFMLWIYYAALVLLFSAELLAAMDAQQPRPAPEADAAA